MLIIAKPRFDCKSIAVLAKRGKLCYNLKLYETALYDFADWKGGTYMKESRRTRFYLDKTGFFAESAMIFLALAIVFRIIGCFTLWGNKVDFLMLLVLPVCACLLMILCILIFGGKGFFLSFIPVLLGLAFFAFKLLFSTSWVSTVLRLVLYVAIAVIYTATVIGWIHTKWLLPPLFGLPFLYHVFVQDIPALLNTAEPVTFSAGMDELSILGIIGAMFCVGIGLKKRAPKQRKRKKDADAPAEEAVPAPVEPAPAAPAPAETPVIAPAPAPFVPEQSPILSDSPYTPVLTLDPDPVEPEESAENTSGESGNE